MGKDGPTEVRVGGVGGWKSCSFIPPPFRQNGGLWKSTIFYAYSHHRIWLNPENFWIFVLHFCKTTFVRQTFVRQISIENFWIGNCRKWNLGKINSNGKCFGLLFLQRLCNTFAEQLLYGKLLQDKLLVWTFEKEVLK